MMTAKKKYLSGWDDKPSVGWKQERLKYVVLMNREELPETTPRGYSFRYYDIGSVESGGNINEPSDHTFENAPSRARRIVRAQDTIVATVRTYLKAVAYFENPDLNTIVSTGFAVLTPRKEKIDPKYLYHQIASEIFVQDVVANSTGVSYPAINPSQLGGLKIILPPISDQKKIAGYLDEKTAAMDEAIAKKRRQVELLKEKRAAVIGDYVTKGLAKDTALVDSGSEWLGKVPAHWKMRRLKFFGRFVGGGTPKTDDRSLWEGGIPWVSSKDMKLPYLEDTEDHINMRAVRESATTMLPKNCLLMVFRSGILIHTIPAAVNTREMAINQDLKALMPSNGVSPRYLMYVILGFQQELLALWRKEGATVESLDLRQVTDTAFPLPSKEEQEAIADVLEAKTAMIDKAVAHIETSIELLSEYKSSLITNVVTGKIAV